MSKSPCKECLCKPLCRNKKYGDMITQCSSVKTFIMIGDKFDYGVLNRDIKNIQSVHRELKPSSWRIRKTSYNGKTFPLVVVTPNDDAYE